MASPGFYLLHRGWQDNPVFRGEEFSRRDAFVWLIEEAAYRERRVAMPKGEITLARGQLSHSFRFMAKAWKWEEPRVRRFITSLSNAQIIDASTVAGQTVITLCNYATYQGDEAEPDAPTDAATTQERRTTDANKKEGNKGTRLEVDKSTSPRASRSVSKSTLEKPDDVSERIWADWRKQRAAKRAPITETVLLKIREEAGIAGITLNDALAEMIARNWQGFKAEWIEGNRRNGRSQDESGYGRTTLAAIDFINGANG